ncbi:DNA-binding MarR family transcriptional regulator [Dinghuibacter silviterrae]|uniref:DNA-binding MarR family transcriptional regulator n=2 Tax=Dinghuibacter silviterrae TaxID=1539049 RepID=A0A4R8DU99_9BACT|nr:DNA-binding MarR family transcriptional regulator [Dinghuibacter silviterrae]
MALGSRLRRLSERLTDQAGAIYALYGNDLQPKWFPVFYVLAEGGERSITDIAVDIGHSHASVSQIAGELAEKGYIKEKKGKNDARKRFIALTQKGKALAAAMQAQYEDVRTAVEQTMKEANHDLWRAIEDWEFLLDRKDLLGRVQDVRRAREAKRLRIVDFRPEHAKAFRDLNERWISTYFKMEEPDYRSLDHPQEYILDKGGHIFMALLDDKPVGTVALIPMAAQSAAKAAAQGAESAAPHGAMSAAPHGAMSAAPHGAMSAAPHGAMSTAPHGAMSAAPHGAKSVVADGAAADVVAADGARSAESAAAAAPQAPDTHELAKMAVSPEAQGLGIGWLLGQAAIERARTLHLRRIYLESNTLLKPAISLYYKLGFQRIVGQPSPYERANIQMELVL